ncbi:MAG: hypothetical protein C4518_20205 [Desulfobacteraceae bacterium]|nr:MAG: hypothetical protein C4518_20205 [Desulfobacteraceae bacterium]
MEPEKQKPDCFGIMDRVFPMTEDGLRHSPRHCMACDYKTECLGTAIRQPAGVAVQEELVDRAYESRTISFIERWSKRKYLDKIKKEKSIPS